MQSDHVQTAIETSAAVSSKSAMVTMGAGGRIGMRKIAVQSILTVIQRALNVYRNRISL